MKDIWWVSFIITSLDSHFIIDMFAVFIFGSICLENMINLSNDQNIRLNACLSFCKIFQNYFQNFSEYLLKYFRIILQYWCTDRWNMELLTASCHWRGSSQLAIVNIPFVASLLKHILFLIPTPSMANMGLCDSSLVATQRIALGRSSVHGVLLITG